MVDFDELRAKAEEMLEEHADQIDSGIDKAADAAGKKYGHSGQIDMGADKLKDFLPGGEEDEQAANRPGAGGGRKPGGQGRAGRQGRAGGGQGRAGGGRGGGHGRPGGQGRRGGAE